MEHISWRKIYKGSPSRFARRALALVLALSMMLPVAAQAADGAVSPTPIVTGEAPTITIEANAVVDRWYDPTSTVMNVEDYLTGELEVAIRVKSGKIDAEWQPFNTVGVALKYSPILTPYKFILIDGIDLSGKEMSADDKKAAAEKVDLTGTNTFKTMTNMQTLKSKNITAAVGHVSGEEGKGGYLFMEAQANRPVVMQEDTVLAVVTFRYDVSQYKIVASQAENWMTPVAATVPGTGESGSEGDGTESRATGDICLLQFVSKAEIDGRYSKYELEYRSATNDMFYSATPDGAEVMSCLPLEDATISKYQGPPTEGQVNFRLVNHTTYNDGGLTLDDLATVLFYDWDDTLIGVLIVPRDGDARKLVNDYVRNNMIHPDLRDGTPVDSLARIDNYRGKYPATKPMSDGATDSTVDTKGGDYPLTNKIDYAFLKRPMALKESGTTSTGEPTSTWGQLEEGGQALWDNGYPYIYGWAVIPDENLTDIKYTHPNNLWTTIGVGELSDYNGALSGGYQELNGAPAELSVSGEEFEFADFNFMQKNHSLKPGSVYAVKAVYEPGEDLLTRGSSYRMISPPYYNKLNNPSAINGGAYNVDVVYERTTIMNDVVSGVARIRQPAVRMETTSDLRWEDEELNNATNSEQRGKGKTTYSNVPVDNVDEVEIQMVLSGRHNKLNYYIMETYGASFVTGGERSVANVTLINTPNHAIDNYNYRTDDSVLTDDYYDAAYEDRDGTYGFVLFGTLNNLSQKLTEYCRNELSQDDYNSYISEDNFNDANIRLSNEKISFALLSRVRNAYIAAVNAAIAAHNAGDNTWWDVEHNCAIFTYHQIQHYISDYDNNGGSATLMTAAAADAKIVPWCHLHDECAAQASGRPRRWSELVSVAQNDTLEEAKRKYSYLSLTEVEDMSHIRSDANGTPFTSTDAFAEKFVAAVKAGNTSWDAIQDHIIRGVGDETYAKANYWWYDGTLSISLTNLTQLINTTPDAMTPVTLPDGTKETRQGKLNQLRPAYDANFALAGDETDPAWVRATENLCADSDAGKFATFDAFKTAFLDAVSKGNAAASVAGEDMTLWRPTWNQLQYVILHPSDPFPLTPTPAQEEEFKTYYWHNGGRKVTDVASLLLAAQRANQGDTVSWEAFQFDALYTYPGLQFRKDFRGTQYASTDFITFKNTILTLAGQGINRTWEQVQYYLIHGSLGGSTAVNGESPYYWWKNGGTGESVDFSAITDYNTAVSVFLDAAFRAEINGNVHAWDGLTAAFDKVKTGRLIKQDNAATTFDTLVHFTDAADFLSAINGISAAAGAKAPGPGQNLVKPDGSKINWQQMQKYLLDDTLTLVGDEDYWWRNNDSQGSQKTPAEYFAEVTAALQAVFDSYAADPDAVDTSAIDAWMGNVDNLNAIFKYQDDGSFIQDDADAIATDGKYFWFDLVDSGDFGSAADVSWYQVQYIVLNLSYDGMTDAEILDDLTNNWGITVPSWVPAPAMVLTNRSNRLAARRPATVVETDEETGIITVTTTTTTELEDGTILRVETVTVRDPADNSMETTTTTTLLDGERNILTQAVTQPVVTPAEPTETETPGCTCGSEDGVHGEKCPLYAAPAPEPSAEPEEPTCTCGSEDGIHTEDCPLYEPTGEKLCTCGSEGGIHSQDCPLYEPTEEKLCTCGSLDDTHSFGCPLYVAPETSDEELADPEVPGADTPVPEPEPEPDPEPGSDLAPEPDPAPEPEMTETDTSGQDPETTEVDTSDQELSGALSARRSKRLSLRLIALTNLFFDSGGWNMNERTTQKNISPPGRWMARAPWLWTMTERRGLA